MLMVQLKGESKLVREKLEAGTQADICTPTFTAALFTTAKRQKQLKCSTYEWIDKMQYTVGNYSPYKRNEILYMLQRE